MYIYMCVYIYIYSYVCYIISLYIYQHPFSNWELGSKKHATTMDSDTYPGTYGRLSLPAQLRFDLLHLFLSQLLQWRPN